MNMSQPDGDVVVFSPRVEVLHKQSYHPLIFQQIKLYISTTKVLTIKGDGIHHYHVYAIVDV